MVLLDPARGHLPSCSDAKAAAAAAMPARLLSAVAAAHMPVATAYEGIQVNQVGESCCLENLRLISQKQHFLEVEKDDREKAKKDA